MYRYVGLFSDCGASISNCLTCALNGENVACSSCATSFYPAELDTVPNGQCAGKINEE